MVMAKKWMLIFKIFLLPFVILTIHYLFNFHRIQIDGWVYEIRFLISGENSKYAPGYSDKKFRQVKNGMTIAELYKLLGQPLSKFPQKDTTLLNQGRYVGLFYARSEVPNTNYRIRFIYLDNGFVTGKPDNEK
jgi:hypothetical protein